MSKSNSDEFPAKQGTDLSKKWDRQTDRPCDCGCPLGSTGHYNNDWATTHEKCGSESQRKPRYVHFWYDLTDIIEARMTHVIVDAVMSTALELRALTRHVNTYFILEPLDLSILRLL